MFALDRDNSYSSHRAIINAKSLCHPVSPGRSGAVAVERKVRKQISAGYRRRQQRGDAKPLTDGALLSARTGTGTGTWRGAT